MKEVIPKDTRYLPFVQQKYCCVPASISVLMYKHGIKLLPQELLGYYLGLTVAKDAERLFWNVKTGKRPPAGYGTRVDKDQDKVNKVFKVLKIPLKMKLLHISDFDSKSFLSYLNGIERFKKDILVCFDHGVLRGDNIPGGHVCVVDRVDAKRHEVRLIDPSPNQPKWRIAKINKLMSAMKFHGDNKSAGFWEFTKK